ncbi:unnamed protein product [Dovyalis caffra]|uniref:Uncharacterized protein n=1 Tax=Dovyalis caffra TaxID=77055 RepID=A0AAV1SLG5_9ROSI|nr:unnamed protein product [Dovyalis caffra]
MLNRGSYKLHKPTKKTSMILVIAMIKKQKGDRNLEWPSMTAFKSLPLSISSTPTSQICYNFGVLWIPSEIDHSFLSATKPPIFGSSKQKNPADILKTSKSGKMKTSVMHSKLLISMLKAVRQYRDFNSAMFSIDHLKILLKYNSSNCENLDMAFSSNMETINLLPLPLDISSAISAPSKSYNLILVHSIFPNKIDRIVLQRFYEVLS